MSETTTETTELALFPKLNLPTVTGITEQMNKSFSTMYTRIEAGIAALPTDMSIKKNREEVASYAYSISRTKTGLDDAAAGVSVEAKQIVDAVNAERRQLKTTLDILRDKARENLTAWEETQAEFQRRTDDALSRLRDRSDDGKDAAELEMVLDNLQNWKITAEIYGDFLDAVTGAHLAAIDHVETLLEKRRKYEAEQVELEQLRREKAEREEADRIKREQEEAEKAARMAEEKLLIDAENERIRQEEERARIAKEAEEKAAREAEEKIEAERRAKEQAERDRQEAEERHAKAIADAEAARIREAEEAKRREEEAAARAEEEAKRREEEAARKERERIQQEKDAAERQRLAQEKADQERAADLAHRKKVNSAATAAIMKAAAVSEADAQAIVIAIYKGQIPNVSIAY